MGEDAYHGLPGVFVRCVEPYSESDPAALLSQFLVAVGNLIGRGPHFVAGADQHFTNLFAVIVGETAKARKGMSWGQVRQVVQRVDPTWAGSRVKSGLASGEGLISALDADSDKRLLVYEPEFARVLTTAERQGSTLADIIRQAWDGGDLGVLTKSNPLEVTEPHISIVAHITVDELRSLLSDITTVNGFANRFLWVCAKRSKSLPDGEPVPEGTIKDLCEAHQHPIEEARSVRLIERDPEANELWREVYPSLTEGEPGRFGAATARAEAQVMRVASIYALLDGWKTITPEHLKAGLEVWRYCEDSARFIFGDSLANAVANRILHALGARSGEGLSRTEISALFHRNASKQSIDAALSVLQERTLARMEPSFTSPGQRKATERWFAVVQGQPL